MTYDVVFSMGREYDHKEADTLLILHCHGIGKRDPFLEFVVFSPDTDVFFVADSSFPRADTMHIIPN